MGKVTKGGEGKKTVEFRSWSLEKESAFLKAVLEWMFGKKVCGKK